MKLFRCPIEGVNFPIDLEGTETLMGFFTTRFVRAETAEQAELAALKLLRADPKLDAPPEKRTKEAKIYFGSIEEIDSLPEGMTEPGGGYVFYPMGT